MFASKDFLVVVAALAMMTVPECFAQHNARPLPGAPDVSKPFAFSYRSFWPEFVAMGQFRDAGVNTYCVFAANTDNSLGEPYSKYPLVWLGPDQYDLATMDKQFDDVLAVNSNANFICMVDLNSPKWLRQLLKTEEDSFRGLSMACANPAWRKAMSAYLNAVVGHMEQRYGDRVIAYLLASGQTDEWFCMGKGAAGKHKTDAWQAWLKKHGKTAAPVPAQDRLRKATFDNLIRDPLSEQDVIDYAKFTGDLVVDTILDFAAQTRRMIPPHRKIGMFFGYILQITWPMAGVWAGHLEYERLMASPDIDFCISPGIYTDRAVGGGSGFMAPNGTRLRYGKGWLHEIDHRTHTYNYKLSDTVSIGPNSPCKNQEETTAVLKREFALAIVSHASLWCFDMWGGVFKTPETREVVGQAKRLWDAYASKHWKSLAEVALVVDPQSARLLNDCNPAVPHINQKTREKLNRLGAPYEIFSVNDLPHVDLARIKLLIFPGLFEITPERMAMLRKYAFTNNRSIIFAYAPGISDGKTLDPARVKQLTGTEFLTQKKCVVQQDGWQAIYVPGWDGWITTESLRQSAKDAGVTLYCEESVPVYANEGLVAIHMAQGGEKKITLPVECKSAKELFTGKVVPVQNRILTYFFASPDTALFEMQR